MSDPAWTEVPIRTAATQSNRETPVTSWDNLSKRNIDPNQKIHTPQNQDFDPKNVNSLSQNQDFTPHGNQESFHN